MQQIVNYIKTQILSQKNYKTLDNKHKQSTSHHQNIEQKYQNNHHDMISNNKQNYCQGFNGIDGRNNQISMRDIQQYQYHHQKQNIDNKQTQQLKKIKKNTLSPDVSLQTSKQFSGIQDIHLPNIQKIHQINTYTNNTKNNSSQHKQFKDDLQLYNVMTLILQNQKNIQKQIGLLRLSLSRKKIIKNNIINNNTQRKIINDKEQISRIKNNKINNIYQHQSNQNNTLWINKTNKKLKIKQKANAKFKSSLEKKLINSFHHHHLPTPIQVNKKHQKNKNNLPLTDHTNLITKKKIQQTQQSSTLPFSHFLKPNQKYPLIIKQLPSQLTTQTQQKLLNLIKKQNQSHPKCIITQQLKTQFWKQLATRKKQSQILYQQLNNNIEKTNNQLIQLNQQQNKIKNDVINKIYQQCNKGIYK